MAGFDNRRTCACGLVDREQLPALSCGELHDAIACLIVSPARAAEQLDADERRAHALDWRATP